MIRSKKALLLFFYPHKGAVLSLHLRRYKEHFDHQLDPNHSQQMKNCVSLLLSYPKVSSQHPSHLFPPTYFTYHWDSCYSHSLQASVESTTKWFIEIAHENPLLNSLALLPVISGSLQHLLYRTTCSETTQTIGLPLLGDASKAHIQKHFSKLSLNFPFAQLSCYLNNISFIQPKQFHSLNSPFPPWKCL